VCLGSLNADALLTNEPQIKRGKIFTDGLLLLILIRIILQIGRNDNRRLASGF
jgi:hypothetical protein